MDLRSDTVTRPTAGMRAAMADAEVGDDVYGEDPTARRLEERVADLLGHEAAVFTPTGSMANQLGVRLVVRAGEELLCDSSAHIVRAELGAHAALGGVTTRTWRAPGGLIDVEVVKEMAAADASPHLVATGAIAVENTHNFGGGTVQPLERLVALRKFAEQAGIRLHLDGARLWNAHVATGVPLGSYGRLFDTVAVCLSKGLGAPVGSLIAGSAEAMDQARWLRKRLGGGMRQVGLLAAAGLYAVDHHVARLADDHAHARALATRLATVTGLDPDTVTTNMVVVPLSPDGINAPDLAAKARAADVLVSVLDGRTIRLVTHLDVDATACAHAAEVLTDLLSAG